MTGYAQLFLYREAALQRGCICQGTYFIIAVKENERYSREEKREYNKNREADCLLKSAGPQPRGKVCGSGITCSGISSLVFGKRV